jgi:hypothetical protein
MEVEKTMKLKILSIILIATFLCSTASATTLYANETGWYHSGGAFNTTATPIQHAVDNATSGDTVYVWNGSYTESVVYIATASITVEGESKTVTNINSDFGISNTDYVTLKNFNCAGSVSLQSGSDHAVITNAFFKSALFMTANNITFSNNELTNGELSLWGVTNSFFDNNEFVGVLLLNSAADNTFTSNTFNPCSLLDIGLRSISSSNINNTFSDSVFPGHTKESGTTAIHYGSGKNNTFTDTTFESPFAVLMITVGEDVTFVQNDRKIFVPMGGWWKWNDGSPRWYSWENQTVIGLNVTIDGSKSVMHFTDSITASSGSEIFFNIPFFYCNPSTGSFNLTDITWNSTNHNDFYTYEDFYSHDTSTPGVKSFNITATNPAATASIQCGDFGRGTPIQMLVNGIDNGTVTATSAGTASFSYTSGLSGEMNFNISTKNKTGTTIFNNVFNNVTPNGNINYSDWVIGYDAINTTIIPETGSIIVSINQSIITADYQNTSIYDLNITDLDGTLILTDQDITSMRIGAADLFSIWDIHYYINATSNRKAVDYKTLTTNATNIITFTFYDLYPSSNFDCKYNTVSFTTNTSSSSGILEFNKSSWTPGVVRTVDIYMTTTPYRCEWGLCWTYEGDAMVVYLDLNDTTVQNVQAEVTTPSGATTNTSMIDFIDNGMTTWRLDYTNTGVKGTYTIDNFYRDRGNGWELLDSFLSFESVAASGGGSGVSPDEPDEPDDGSGDDGGAGGGGGAQPEPELEHVIAPDNEFVGNCIGGVTTFTGSIVIRVESPGCSRVTVGEYSLNPTTTSLIGGTRYGYANINVEDNPEIGGTVTFRVPDGAEDVALYQLEDNMWIELSSTKVGDTISADVEHFSYFALAEGGMESVIESMTQLSLTPPKVSGILVWKWLSDTYTSTHIANRELMNVSSSEGMICEILTTGDYANRTLKCTYTPPEDEEWSSLKYTGEIIAIDTDGYTRRIPVGVNVYDMDKLGFPVFALIILLGGIILYRKYE